MHIIYVKLNIISYWCLIGGKSLCTNSEFKTTNKKNMSRSICAIFSETKLILNLLEREILSWDSLKFIETLEEGRKNQTMWIFVPTFCQCNSGLVLRKSLLPNSALTVHFNYVVFSENWGDFVVPVKPMKVLSLFLRSGFNFSTSIYVFYISPFLLSCFLLELLRFLGKPSNCI